MLKKNREFDIQMSKGRSYTLKQKYQRKMLLNNYNASGNESDFLLLREHKRIDTNLLTNDKGNNMNTDLNEKNKAYGCLFCITGKENVVANCIQIYNKNVHAKAACQTMRHTSQGITRLQNDVILKGYVFFETAADATLTGLLPPNDILSVLSYSDGDWRLCGDDLEYAKWIFKYNGVLPLSKAYKVGDRIFIIDGPLKDLEGSITRIDKRNRSGQVTINFAGREQKVWLGFDIVKEFNASDEVQASSL